MLDLGSIILLLFVVLLVVQLFLVSPKTETKDVKTEPAQSKASSLASKFSKPAEEKPAPKSPAQKKVGSLNVSSKFSKFSDAPADKSNALDKKSAASKGLAVEKFAPKDKQSKDGKMMTVTVDKTEIPGGEITTKKSVTVDKSPDGSTTTTTTVSTSAVKTEKFGGDGGVGSKTSKVFTKQVKSETFSSSEQVSNDVSKQPESKKPGKISEEFWKKAEEDKKKVSPMQQSSHGIGNLKSRFQGGGGDNSTASPSKFGKGRNLNTIRKLT